MQALWLIAAVLLAVLEAATAQLVSIWFACGAVCSMISAYFTDNVLAQLTVFVLSSVVFLLISRIFVKRLDKNIISTNSDSLIGKTVITTEKVDNDRETGTAKINGVVWSVRSETGETIEAGTKVVIKKINGVRLIVGKEG